MKEKILFQLVFTLIKMLPADALVGLIKKYCGQMADWIIAKAEASSNKVDDAIIGFFRDVFQHLGLDALEQMADTVMDLIEDSEGNATGKGICKSIRFLFSIDDNDMVATVSPHKILGMRIIAASQQSEII